MKKLLQKKVSEVKDYVKNLPEAEKVAGGDVWQ